MILLNLIERVQEKFPQAGVPWLIKEFDTAQKHFAYDTRLIQKVWTITPDGSLTYTLPSDLIAFQRVFVKDSSGNYLDDLKWDVITEVVTAVHKQRIKFYPWEDPTATTMPGTVASIDIEYAAKATTISTSSATLEIADEFSEALFAEVMRKMEGMNGNEKASLFWEREYERHKQRALRDVRMGKFLGARFIAPPTDLA